MSQINTASSRNIYFHFNLQAKYFLVHLALISLIFEQFIFTARSQFTNTDSFFGSIYYFNALGLYQSRLKPPTNHLTL